MTYLNGYKHDVFISYAHRDDCKEIEPGWVHVFAEQLKAVLKRELKSTRSENINVFWDYSIKSNEPLSKQLKQDIEGSAVFVVIIGKHYLDSTWCKDELVWFSKAVIDQHRADSRLFIVYQEDINVSALPKVFQGPPGYDFFDESRGQKRTATLAWPNAKINPEREFYEMLDILMTEIAKELSLLEKHSNKSRPTSVQDHADSICDQEMSVFLAITDDDICSERDKLKEILINKGIKVFPDESQDDLIEDTELFETVMTQRLPKCNLIIQLHGTGCTPFPNEPCGWIGWQRRRFQENKIEIIDWISPSSQIDQIKNTHYKHFLQQMANLRRVKLRDFSSHISSLIQLSDMRSATGNIFINVSEEDTAVPFAREIANRIIQIIHENTILKRVSMFVNFPQTQLNAKRYDEERREQLIDCDGHCIIYGEFSPLWVKRQYEEQLKARLKRKKLGKKDRPIIRIIDAPPPEVPLDTYVSDCKILNFRDHINDDDLKTFLLEVVTESDHYV